MILFILLYYKVKPRQHTTSGDEDKRDIVIKIVKIFFGLCHLKNH